MILIADSGSTKCDWVLCDFLGNIKKEFLTIGFNPYFIDKNSIIDTLEESNLDNYKKKINHVFFYGAGCSSKENKNAIKIPLMQFFTNAKIKISHDLYAACFAMYKGKPNITCILGTGSNSCFYDGKEIYEHGPSLGFIMGDEASGNHFGKKIINPRSLKLIISQQDQSILIIISQTEKNQAKLIIRQLKIFGLKKKNIKTINIS